MGRTRAAPALCVPFDREVSTVPLLIRALPVALTLSVLACGQAPTVSAASPVDAGADADVQARPSCPAGGLRGAVIAEPIDPPGRLVGASHGRVYWADLERRALWSMAQDGSDRRAIYMPAKSSTFALGSDGIYVAGNEMGSTPVVRVPFEGGQTETLPVGYQSYLFAVDEDSLYLSKETVVRVAKAGGATVTLGTAGGPGLATLSGTTIWINDVDGLRWLDARGDGSQPAKAVGDRCEYFEAGEGRAACARDRSLTLVSRDGTVQTLIARPMVVVAGTFAPVPRAFVRHGAGREGLLFSTATLGTTSVSFDWIDLEGGAPIELTCADSDPTLAVDGNQLFMLDVDSGDSLTARAQQRVSRVDLR